MDKDREKEMKIDIESAEKISAEEVEDAINEPDEELAEEKEKDAKEGRAGEDEYRELNDKYLRLYAEFENYRKRVAKDKEDIQKYGTEALLYDLLTVIDTLEMALSHANDDDGSGALREGIEMTLREFYKVIKQYGVEPVKAEGERFDPSYHEAMSHVERDDVDEGEIVEEFRKGYRFHGKLLRPALVAVAKGTVSEENNRETSTIKEEEQDG